MDVLQTGDHATGTNGCTKTPYFGFNIMEWIRSPKKYSKGLNIHAHINSVQQFLTNIQAPVSYFNVILINSLDEECQMEMFSHPDYDEKNDDIENTIFILKKMYNENKTEISNLVVLLEEKQEVSETATAFLSRLRVKAYKTMGLCEKKQKEKCILHAFINGLNNKRISKAVEILKPANAEEALIVAKNEEAKQKMRSEKDCFAFATDQDQHASAMIKEMSIQIKLLSEQVTFLTNMMKRKNYESRPIFQIKRNSGNDENNFRNKTYAQAVRGGNYRPARIQQRPSNANFPAQSNFTCWNCNEIGHSFKNCSKRLYCKKCSRAGHMARFCRSGDAVRYFDYDENLINDDAPEENLSITTGNADDVDDCLVITEKHESNQTKQRTSKMQKVPKKKRPINHYKNDTYHENIDEWVNYVNGHTARKPSFPSPTVISKSRTEKSANKPLVHGECEGKATPILIDSGAALNVIDESFIRQMGNIKIQPENMNIRCANNEKIKSLGRVSLRTKIGQYEKVMTFSIIPNLFPRIIIGLRQMKHSSIFLDARSDCVWIENERIPFISKTKSFTSENQ